MKTLHKIILLLAMAGQFASPAYADLKAKFDEGAPKDRFTFTNTGNCSITGAVIKLDLSTSDAGLIFDTTASGKGVEVFQPLEIVSGATSIVDMTNPRDGDNSLEIRVGELPAQKSIAFTVDIDDTLGKSETVVSDLEISGTSVEMIIGSTVLRGSFETTPQTILSTPEC